MGWMEKIKNIKVDNPLFKKNYITNLKLKNY